MARRINYYTRRDETENVCLLCTATYREVFGWLSTDGPGADSTSPYPTVCVPHHFFHYDQQTLSTYITITKLSPAPTSLLSHPQRPHHHCYHYYYHHDHPCN